MSPAAVLLPLVPALPLLWAALALLPRARALVAGTAAIPALPALLAAALLPEGAGATTDWLLLGTEWRLEGPGRPLLAVSGLLWAAAGLFGRGYLAGKARRWRFDGFFQLTMAGSLGLIVAVDAVGFYTLFAVMSLASYGLVVHHGDAEARRAGRVYIILAVAGEVGLLVGLVGLAGGFPGTWPALALGLAIKAGVLPLHVWLALAHPVAPVPASAVLSGAMVKAGLLGWLRFPPPETPEFWGLMMAGLGAVGALYAGLVGLTQTRPKVVLAYSTVSQMGVMTAALGLAWARPEAAALAAAVVAYAVHHALTKGTLFLGVGWLEAGGGAAARLTVWLGALVMAGLPATGGAAAKALLKEPLGALPAAYGPAGWWLTASAVVTAVLMARVLVVLPGGGNGTARSMGLATLGLAIAMLAVPWAWPPLAAGAAYSVTKGLAGTLAPLGVAGVAAAALIRWRGARPWGPAVPVGDLLALLPLPGWPWALPTLPRRRLRGRIRQQLGEASGRLRRGEAALAGWGATGLVLLGLAAVLGMVLGR
ncbi:complex I subunit 5 family protein [Thiohalorhabdus sp.]|uniref:complex I subunit 5 family protein n=1 Tax=Thiohalorhabdus sp. TaxID=3094134 RepID=UPI002FC2F3A6